MQGEPQEATSEAPVFVGKHIVRIEPPMLLVEAHGPLTVEEYEAVHARLCTALAAGQVSYFLMNIADAEVPSPQVRARMRERPASGLPLRATITYGGSPILVAMAQLIRRGLDLMSRSRSRFVMFRTEDEARSWVAADCTSPASSSPSIK